MSFDRFFKVALLVVLLAFVAVYLLNGQQSAYGQGTTKTAGDIFRQLAAQQRKRAAPPKEVGRYQFAAAGGTLYALDTRTGQLYILRDAAMSPKEATQGVKWQQWYSFTDQKYGPQGHFGIKKAK